MTQIIFEIDSYALKWFMGCIKLGGPLPFDELCGATGARRTGRLNYRPRRDASRSGRTGRLQVVPSGGLSVA